MLDKALRDKIRRRAKRAFEDFDDIKKPCPTCGRGGETLKRIHRITEVTATSLKYRIRGNSGLHSGPTITIKRDKLGRIRVPVDAEA